MLKPILKTMSSIVLLCGALNSAIAGEVTLTASKDTFGRSNLLNKNNGGNSYLAVAQAPSVRTIIAFDLGAVTNTITAAKFEFRQHNTVDVPISLTVSTMVQTPNNAVWNEGRGSLGIQGQNAVIGDSTFAWRSFRDLSWESGEGASVVTLADAGLWDTTIAHRANLKWKEGTWVSIPLSDVGFLNEIRKSETPVTTFGLWGTSGKGFYFISSRESGYAARLVLSVSDTVK